MHGSDHGASLWIDRPDAEKTLESLAASHQAKDALRSLIRGGSLSFAKHMTRTCAGK